MMSTAESQAMDYSYSDPAVAAFVVLPVLVALALVWGTAIAWRRSGAPREAAQRAALVAAGAQPNLFRARNVVI